MRLTHLIILIGINSTTRIVSDSRMDDEEELRSQCFGGDHSPSSFDPPNMKRCVSFSLPLSLLDASRRSFSQRRWWNAYILFYERVVDDASGAVDGLSSLQICSCSHFVLCSSSIFCLS